MDKEIQPQLDQLYKLFPADIGRVKINEGGEDFRILETSSGWMFRFPRNEMSQVALRREVQFLARFKERSPIAVPDYRYVADNMGGYPKIQGVPLSIELFQSLSKTIQRKIGQQLGSFLSAIHDFPVEEAVAIGLTVGWNGVHQGNGEYFLEHIAHLLSPTARKNAVECVEMVLSEEFAGTVIHGDFYLPDHVIYEPADAGLGVIDFADVTIYDPAHDFQCIVEIGGESFFGLVMAHYQGQTDPGLLRRSKLRLAARPLFVAGYVFARGLEDQYPARLARIESVFG